MCPPSSIEALSVPIVLSDNQSSRPLPSPSANAPHTPLQVQNGASMPASSQVLGNDLLSADALARLFSVDMVPQTNQPAPDVLQVVNSYITPFFGNTPTMAPEYASLDNTEANMVANLGNVATERQRASPQDWMPVGFNDGQLRDVATEQLSQSFLDAESMFTIGTDFAGNSADMLSMLAGSSGSTPQVASALPLHMQALASNPPHTPSIPNSRASTVHAGTSPPNTPAGSRPAALQRSKTDPSEYQKAPSKLKRKSPETTQDSMLAEGDVPHILQEYVAAIPGNPSAAVIYRIMRDSFKAPRMGMVSLNMELLWFMLHKGVLPRIVFYGHIASTIRFSVANFNVKSMVPPHIDESCYKLALEEVPLVKDSSAIWGAIALCMITRYEFQSSRYKEMTEHVDMALDIMHRIRFNGHSYPWHDVPAEDKEGFGFQYLIAIYWKCFWWKLISLLLIEQCDSFESSLDNLPEYSSKTYDLYTVDKPYNVDLMEMIPPGSWLNSETPVTIRFCGPSDPEFMSMRPPNSPCFGRESLTGAYLQQLLVVYAKFFVLKCQARAGKVDLCRLLKGLWAFRERMDVWRNSLPPSMVLDHSLVADYLETIKPESSATSREIDLKASHLKDVIMLLLAYHTFLVRANRFVMKMMLGEPLDVPPPDISTLAFALRDLYDSKTSPPVVAESIGYMNMYFHGCRIQAIKSANALCSIAQAAYLCKFNFYTLGSQIVFTMLEILVVYVSFLGNYDENIAWRSKSRLSNVFNILRMLRHWAPALHVFVAGIKALSDPRFYLEEPRNFNAIKREILDPAMLDMSDSPIDSAAASDAEESGSVLPKRRRVVRMPQALESPSDARTNIMTSIAPHGSAEPGVRRDETLSYRAADPIPEFPNPFPPNHIISLVIKDLGLSLAEFLAPAYPILLLKIIPSQALPSGDKP
ncbi:hypothetical protein EV183_004540 [Coemansia sp. RSA 2336]|nr:hypothetical protein EV183_004540 [Coemansia sp. RSA 2336]